ncbi:MAG: pyridoxal phosphate-dependent aminotransferase [Spirochaetes bacterium]|nr:pyridoxal phosphate-dependent aminotransferase [Spirochaetota bacterium]
MSQPVITSARFFVGRTGDGLISFGSGQPDLPPPRAVFDILPHYSAFKYGLTQGQENLREALSKQYPHASPEQFVITNGASEALDLSLRVLARFHGAKRCLIPRPYYYSYPFNVEFAPMGVEYYDLKDGKIDLDHFLEQMKKADVVLINSPSNPTGAVQDIPVLKEIERLTQEKNLWVISDEVYKDLIYDRDNYLIQGERVITINSFSKTYAMCGYRVGYLYGRQSDFIDMVVEMKNHTSMNTNILGQEMAYTATCVPMDEINKQVAVWRERRDTIYDGMKALGLDLWKPEGAFYVFPKMKDSTRVVNELYYKHNMITYDGAWFGAPDRVRFSYALEVSKILEGLERLEGYLKKNPGVVSG